MKIFANKKIWKRIVIIYLLISIFTFTTPEPVSADMGGELMSPIMSLFIGLADGVNTVINRFFLQQDKTIITVTTGIRNPVIRFGIKLGLKIWKVTSLVVGSPLYNIYRGVKFVINTYKEYKGEKVEKVEERDEYQKVSPFSAKALLGDELILPIINFSPYEIFSNKDEIFSVNIFKAKNDDDTLISTIRESVRNWYSTLRLIAIVGMMSVLVYIGIRILISSAAESKAKYKQMLWDWLMATCLIFVMHYIMIFANLLVDSISEMIDSIHVEVESSDGKFDKYVDEQGVEGFLIGVQTKEGDKDANVEIDSNSSKLVERAFEDIIGDEVPDEIDENSFAYAYKDYFWKDLDGTPAKNSSEAKVLFWPAKNFTMQARMYAQKAKQEDGEQGDYNYIGFGLIYVILTIYTIIFSWVYLRRLIYMIFLTLISPLVALTYPIDKVKDGQAQAFNFWFKEYMYNLLLQPLHLLLYMLLIGSAMQFATENPIYVIVALGFMVPAEKLVKAMFGFKGQTPGSMPGLAAGALMMHATRNLFGKLPKPIGSSDGKGDRSDNNTSVPTKTNSPRPWNNKDLFSEDKSVQNGNGELDEQGQAMLSHIEDQDNYLNSGSGSTSNTSGNTDNNSVNTGNNVESEKENVPAKNIVRKIGRPRATARALKNAVWDKRLTSGRWWGKKGKKALRFGAGAFLGATGATMGGIATIVGGDPSKAIENMGLGGLAGYKFGSGAAGSITDGTINTFKNVNSAIDNEYYAGRPDEYARKQMDEYIKNWKKEQSNLDILKRNVSDERYKQLINGNEIQKYINSGYTDAKDIAAAERFSEQTGKDREVSIDVLQINKEIANGDFTKLNINEKDKWRETLKDKFKKQGGISDQQVQANAKQAEEYLEAISKIRSKIQ